MTRIIRTFSSIELSGADDELTLDEEESYHLGKVLRAQVGSSVEVLDGRGSLANAEITKLDRRATRVKILGRKSVAQPKPFFRLAVAMTKTNRWEEMIRPLTELGVGCITPLVTERTEVRVSAGKEMSKLAKWRKLAIEACKQSGNPWLPKIDVPVSLGELFRDNESAAFMASLRSHSIKPLVELDHGTERVLLIIGPEGGWVSAEEDLAVENGVNLFSLGSNILRAETAALCALAVARVGFLD
jgi:16S rRNA (uracil1498-N3)-methyltransferase